MKYKEAERIVALESLRWSLESVTHTGLLLVWLYSYLSMYFAQIVADEFVCNRSTCIKSAGSDNDKFIRHLAKFRNKYVHEGVKDIKSNLQDITNNVDCKAVNRLFTEISVPQNAVDLFWKWYNSSVVE